MKPLAIVTGVGPGTGAALVRRFQEGGYQVAMLARNADRLRALETELTDNFSLNFSAGYASIYADTQLKFRETVMIANPGIPALAATDTTAGGRNWQSGFYAQLRGTWQFSPNVGVYVAGDFQSNENFEFSDAGQDIKLDFKTTYGVGLGLIFSW